MDLVHQHAPGELTDQRREGADAQGHAWIRQGPAALREPDGDKWPETRLNRSGEEVQAIQSEPATRHTRHQQ